MITRRGLLKGLVAAPVVAKVGVEAIAKHEYEWVERKDVVDRLREGYTIVNRGHVPIKAGERLRIGDPVKVVNGKAFKAAIT
jgi:hypothetical protein